MNKRGPHSKEVGEQSGTTILTREQDRRLRAQAWRHVRRIIGKARAAHVWTGVRARQAND